MLKYEQDFSYNDGGDAKPLKNGQTFHPYSRSKSQNCESQIIQNNKLTKTLHMKYKDIIYSCQVLEKIKKHMKIRAFVTYNPGKCFTKTQFLCILRYL